MSVIVKTFKSADQTVAASSSSSSLLMRTDDVRDAVSHKTTSVGGPRRPVRVLYVGSCYRIVKIRSAQQFLCLAAVTRRSVVLRLIANAFSDFLILTGRLWSFSDYYHVFRRHACHIIVYTGCAQIG